MPYAETEHGKLYYEGHGSGTPLLCIQGLAMDATGWRPQIPAWSRQYRVIVFDNRDAGRSFYAAAPYDIATLAGDTVALADRLGLERFHLLGSSMGGAVAQELALAHPERVASLTLSVTYAGQSAWSRERLRLAVRSGARKSDQEIALELMLLTLSEESFEEIKDQVETMVKLLLSNPHRQRREGYVRQLEAVAGHEARQRLGALRMPVHVIGAERDIFVPVWRVRELASLIPGARLSVVPGAAHAVNLERPAEYNALVLEFLQVVEHSP